MASTTKQVKVELPNTLRLYTDGTVERLWGPPTAPATLNDPETGVSSKDIILCPTTNLTARIYLPQPTSSSHQQKLPIAVYFHGGGFCLKSAFSSTEHRYMNHLSSHAHVIIVNVEYRLAPEHPLPAAYEDGFTAVNSLSKLEEPWLVIHGDFDKIFVGGDSAGANIAHNVAMRAGNDIIGEKGEIDSLYNEQVSNNKSVKIHGIFLCHSFFLGPKRVGTRPPQHDMGFNKEKAFDMWELAYPGAGPHHHMINPLVKDGPSLKGLGCDKVLVVIGEKDDIVDWGVLYYNGLKESGFGGSVELFEVKGEGHSFQIFNPTTDNAKLMIQRLASFFNQ